MSLMMVVIDELYPVYTLLEKADGVEIELSPAFVEQFRTAEKLFFHMQGELHKKLREKGYEKQLVF